MLFPNLDGVRLFRFIISGGLNTLISYGIYLLLLPLFSYQASYGIAYVAGIAVSYGLNRFFVFKKHQGLRSIMLFPIVYVIQFCFGILFLWLLVRKIGITEAFAPLIVVLMTIPVTYVLTRFVFLGRIREE